MPGEKLSQQNIENVEIENNEPHLSNLMERSHQQALVAFKIEQALIGKEIDNLGHNDNHVERAKKLAKDLPEDKARVFIDIIDKYFLQQQKSLSENWELLELLKSQTELAGEPITPFVLGQDVFTKRVGAVPVSKVEFYQQEAYFIMACENSIDYACAKEGKPSDQISQKSLRSGGAFHGAMKIKIGNKDIETPVLLINGLSRERIRQIIDHERQHFINHKLFDLFAKSERQGAPKYLRDIKDEVLSYMRDNSSGKRLKESLYSELYTHLFAKVPAEERDIVAKTIDCVAEFIDSNLTYIGFCPESRAILVYQLAGIPFDRFPAWLEEYNKHYGKRRKLMDQFYDTRINRDLFGDRFLFPKKIKPAMQKLIDVDKKLEDIKEKAMKTVFNLAISQSDCEDKLEDLLMQQKVLLEYARESENKFSRNGVVMPHIADGRIFKKYEDPAKAKFDQNDFTNAIEEKVLVVVKDFRQQEIDKLAEYINGKQSKTPESLAELEKIIKEAVEQKGGQEARVDFRIIGASSNSFLVVVQYKFSNDLQEKGLGGAIFELIFHGSKFKIITQKT